MATDGLATRDASLICISLMSCARCTRCRRLHALCFIKNKPVASFTEQTPRLRLGHGVMYQVRMEHKAVSSRLAITNRIAQRNVALSIRTLLRAAGRAVRHAHDVRHTLAH